MIHKKIKLTGLALMMAMASFAGNKDRAGQSAASELLINPWGLSSGLFGLNGAQVTGVEAMKLNVGGLAKTETTEFGLAHTRYLAGTGLSISNAGLAHNLGNDLVIGVNIMSFSFGTIPITTENSPQGGVGEYKPNFTNVSLAVGKKFSENMSAGLQATYVNEAISNVRGSALGFDAGVEYVNGKNNNLHIGVTLKNVGTNLRFSGDGFKYTSYSPDLAKTTTVSTPVNKFALPSQLSFAVAYDFYLKSKGDTVEVEDGMAPSKHRLTPMISFISNSFSNDWLGVGMEYGYKEKFMARAAYRFENGIADKETTTTLYTGLSAGVSFATKLNSKENAHSVTFDYGFRSTRIANGVHTLGLRMALGGKEKK